MSRFPDGVNGPVGPLKATSGVPTGSPGVGPDAGGVEGPLPPDAPLPGVPGVVCGVAAQAPISAIKAAA